MALQKHILIIGGGFLGKNFAETFHQAGFPVALFSRSLPQKGQKLAGVKYFAGDFLNGEDLREPLAGAKAVIHCLSSTTPRSGDLDPARDIENNLVGTVKLLDYMVELGIPKLVYCSSGGTVYGESSHSREEDRKEPICSYGITKLAVEKYIWLYHKRHGLSFQVLRISNPYGPYQQVKNQLGVINTFLNKILENKPIKVFGDGETARDYIYIEDLNKIVLSLYQKDSWDLFINIASGKTTTLKEICHLLGKITGKNLEVIYEKERLCDLKISSLNIEKLKELLPQLSFTPIERGMKLHYKHLLDEKEG